MTKEFEKDPSVFYHRLVETYKHVYAYRAQIGDENFLDLDKVSIRKGQAVGVRRFKAVCYSL